MRFFWVNGRLGWPLVSAIVFITASALVLDYIWRTVIIPADKLLVYAVVIEVTLAIACILGYRSVRARFNR